VSGTNLAAAFGVGAAASWGGGDFVGGLATRRAGALYVVPLSRVSGIAVQVALALVLREHRPAFAALAWATAAGAAGAVGLAAFYRSLAVGQMGVNAPLTAVLSASFPVLVGATSQGVPTFVRSLGFALALAGVWCLSRSPGAAGRPRGLGLAVLAGFAFGAFFVLIAQVRGPSVFWPLVVATTAALAVLLALALAGGRGAPPARQIVGLALLAGAFDAGGNACFLLAAHAGRLDVAAVLASLYPAVTTLLAALVLKERLTRTQTLGVAAALVAMPLIAG